MTQDRQALTVRQQRQELCGFGRLRYTLPNDPGSGAFLLLAEGAQRACV